MVGRLRFGPDGLLYHSRPGRRIAAERDARAGHVAVVTPEGKDSFASTPTARPPAAGKSLRLTRSTRTGPIGSGNGGLPPFVECVVRGGCSSRSTTGLAEASRPDSRLLGARTRLAAHARVGPAGRVSLEIHEPCFERGNAGIRSARPSRTRFRHSVEDIVDRQRRYFFSFFLRLGFCRACGFIDDGATRGPCRSGHEQAGARRA